MKALLNLKYELGDSLYRTITDMVANHQENENLFKKFKKGNLRKLEKVYLKYKDTDPLVLLYNFLSLYSLHTGEESILGGRKKEFIDVTKPFDSGTLSQEKLEEFQKSNIL